VQIRLQRYLAMSGVASRRRAEQMITEGGVRVNNRVVTELGTKVDPERDRVTVAGNRVQPEEKAYLLLNKPEGTIATMSDPEGRPTVAALLPRRMGARLFPVGRLDFNTAGALLFTNDGDMAQALTKGRPIEKTYHAKVRGVPTEPTLEKLRKGGKVEGGTTGPMRVALVTGTAQNTWLEFILTERVQDAVRKACDAVGHPVTKLIRVAIGEIGIEGLEVGTTRELTDGEIADLRQLVGIAKPKPMRTRGRRKSERTGPRTPAPRPSPRRRG
jgi:23S rRNA pseudouridine2605 synthase